MTDFEEALAAGFQHVYTNASVVGCWFHYAQAIIKLTNKIGLKEAYGSDEDVQNVVQCLVSLPLLPQIVHLCLIWCHVVRSRDVHPCDMVSRCPFSRCQSPQF